MPQTYTCCGSDCKRQFYGEPYKNCCGLFCPECKEKMFAATIAATRRRTQEVRGICPWCRKPSDADGTSKDTHNAHYKCERNREWMRGCLEESDYLLKYVIRVNEELAPRRDERVRMEAAARRRQEKQEAKPVGAPGQQHVVRLLEQLLRALGEKPEEGAAS